MTQRPRSLDEWGRLQCPRCNQWKYLPNYSRDKKRPPLFAGTYCLECANWLVKNKYSKAAKERARLQRELDALGELADMIDALKDQEPLGPPIDGSTTA